MATTNFTGDGKQKTYELPCSTESTEGIHNPLTCLQALNVFLSITAFLGNTLVLIALHKECSLHPPSKLLFRTLATTDLCVGNITGPLLVTYFMSVMNERWSICHYAFLVLHITGYILSGVSLSTKTATSLEKLLALLLGLRYRQVVTLKRTYITVTMFWVFSIAGSTLYFLNHLISVWYRYTAIPLCQITSIFCYSKIVLTLRRHELQVRDNFNQGHPSETSPVNIARYRKTVSSALWVQLTSVVCYLPFGIIVAFIAQIGQSPSFYLFWVFAALLAF